LLYRALAVVSHQYEIRSIQLHYLLEPGPGDTAETFSELPNLFLMRFAISNGLETALKGTRDKVSRECHHNDYENLET
jgi:hypothetical protein